MRCFGARSSAGEHYVDIVGVTGSIPVAPTIFPVSQQRVNDGQGSNLGASSCLNKARTLPKCREPLGNARAVCSANVPEGQGAQKEIAARTNRSGGEAKSKNDQRHDSREPARRASLTMLPVWSDDRCLVGWLSLAEAAALALSHVGWRP